MLKTSGDVDVLVITKDFTELLSILKSSCSHEFCVKHILAEGPTKVSLLIQHNHAEFFQMDIRCIEENSWYAALLYFTGSAQNNIRMRGIAKKKNVTLNEYFLKLSDGSIMYPKSEKEVFDFLEIPYLEPEDR